jgi:nanoRNase/pAp phosphatase (c-di-AMP/oligoRNAs hydrolase)
MPEEVKKILALIETINAQLVVLLCHHNADPDAVCSAYSLSKLLQYLRPNLEVEIVASFGISRLTKSIIDNLPIRLAETANIEKAGLLILLDTNTIQQLNHLAEKVKSSGKPIIVIDHHASHPETEQLATLSISDETASSTCEIIYRFFKEMNVTPDLSVAKALFLGIAFDTRHFVLANSSTFKTIAELIETGVNAQEALSMLSIPMDDSERIARLKASKRAKLMKIGEWIVAFSHVSAFQASAARSLIELGAHVAVVAGQKNDLVNLSLRATREFHEKTGLHLGKDIAKPLGEYLHGMGGGHSVSAGVNGIGDVETALKRCLHIFKEKLEIA